MMLPTSRIAAASLLFLFAGRATLAPGQSIIASMRPDPTSTSSQFAQIDIGTGLSTPISPLGPNSYAGLGATASGQFYGVRSNQLWQVDIRENTETAIGPLAQEGIFPASGFDILPDGRAFASTANRIYSVDLASGLATQLTSDNGVREALMAAGSTFPAPVLGSLGSVVNDRLYAVDLLSRSLLAISPDTGAVEVVGGSAGVLASGMLSSGIARDRYRIGSALTGVDIDRDGLFDTLIWAL